MTYPTSAFFLEGALPLTPCLIYARDVVQLGRFQVSPGSSRFNRTFRSASLELEDLFASTMRFRPTRGAVESQNVQSHLSLSMSGLRPGILCTRRRHRPVSPVLHCPIAHHGVRAVWGLLQYLSFQLSRTYCHRTTAQSSQPTSSSLSPWIIPSQPHS